MTKLFSLPPKKTNSLTWLEAMQSMIDNADETTRNNKVRNMLIISEDKVDYSFGLLNEIEVRSMLGTLECVKAYFIDVMQGLSDYHYDSEDD